MPRFKTTLGLLLATLLWVAPTAGAAETPAPAAGDAELEAWLAGGLTATLAAERGAAELLSCPTTTFFTVWYSYYCYCTYREDCSCDGICRFSLASSSCPVCPR